ncbi:ABC transporter substrate-binding protein [Pelomonas sp. KK5]|uniref:ABC transporter substrate-binding protein n=1 Tax=Pelomonas sp. KK5 TaxID=1855730 RepID=UPI00097C4073|nr:ABC transporter substrate-binding protein [Pelomonas sp. KK5]
MRRLAGLLLLSFACITAQGQVLRWAAQGDPQTMDPHSQNESLTNAVNGQIYEKLTRRDRQLNVVPGLATEWTQVSPLLWRFKLRPGVKFHDGTPFTADDVVFSVKRAQGPTSQVSPYANALGTPRKVDELTVEFQLERFTPIFLQQLDTVHMMSRRWCEAHGATRALDYTSKEETYAALHANGTGPYMLVSRAPDIKTVLKRNPAWWNRFEGNVQEVVFTPIANDATRLAALVSGEIDFVLDPSPRDVPRLRATPGVQVIEGPENRLVFIGLDQGRDKLLYGKVPGDRNPFKDLRVRRAMYQAIDIEALRSKVMNGLAVPTGGLTPTIAGAFGDATLETRLPYDIAAARRQMAEAGYAEGFEVTLDCPNNRYINDEAICKALAAMWAQLKIKVRVSALPRALYFPKVEKMDTSLYMFGWGGNITDPEVILTPVFRNRGERGVGYYNYGNVRNDAFDALAARSSVEQDPAKRAELVKAALAEYRQQVNVIPLHRQMIPWAVRRGVSVVHRADNWLETSWVVIGAGTAGK